MSQLKAEFKAVNATTVNFMVNLNREIQNLEDYAANIQSPTLLKEAQDKLANLRKVHDQMGVAVRAILEVDVKLM